MSTKKPLPTTNPPEVEFQTPQRDFTDGDLYQKYERAVRKSDNDFIVVIAASSKSGISGVGKTTLGVTAARYFDASPGGFNAEDKSTLNPDTFSKNLLTDPERVPNKSAIIFDEAQGTLSSQGADARRSMAQSVMDVTTALSTMRFRQNTAIIISQSTKWIDKRIDDIMDALILIQDTDPVNNTVRAEVFKTYYNDLSLNPTRYTEHMDTINWPELPKDDPDYQYLHERKEKSAMRQLEEEKEEEEDQTLPKEKQIEIAQELRDNGLTTKEVSQSGLIEFGQSWVLKHTES